MDFTFSKVKDLKPETLVKLYFANGTFLEICKISEKDQLLFGTP